MLNVGCSQNHAAHLLPCPVPAWSRPGPALCSAHLKTQADSFPPGLNNAYLFAVFNSLSFQIVLSSPMVLYAKSLHASATVLGIIAGMMPLLVIFQIPAAHYISRVGYKRFVYAGWGTRVLFIFGLALVPLTGGFLDAGSRLALLLTLLFCFNLSRGISSCAWLPWITSLVPVEVRGKYLARDAAWVNLASFVSFLVAALWLGNAPPPGRFALLFTFSAVMGATSLIFLKRIPEVAVPGEDRAGTGPVPWLEMARYAPFRKLLRMVIAWAVAYGGMSAFTVLFLKTEAGFAEGKILLITSTLFLGGLSSLWFLGSRLDNLGSKPVLTFSCLAWFAVLLVWMFIAGGLLAPGLPLVLALQFLMGLGASLIGMSTTRLAMAIVPAMGRNHFFALYSVLGSLAMGLAPVVWGLLLDAAGGVRAGWGGFEWNHYSLFFAAVGVMILVTLFFARRLDEPKAAGLDELLKEILVQSPQRAWLRLWPRG